MKKVYLIIFILVSLKSAFGQDPQFTQFYAAPMYHNPAFTGSAYAPRIMMNYRNQWPSLQANFITSMFSIDHYIDKYNSGIGLMVLSDKQGYNLMNTEVRFSYAYEVTLSKDEGLRFGLNGGVSSRGLTPNGLIFGDQLDNNGKTGNASSDPWADRNNLQLSNNIDIGAGVLYFKPQYFLGVSLNHVNKAKLSFIKNTGGDYPTMPMLLVVNGGYNISLDEFITDSYSEREFTITPTFLFKQQGTYSQLDLGAYVTYTPLTFGLQYRGIPLSKVFNSFPNQDAVSGMIGLRYENFSFGYSYDLTISGLGGSSGGSHEISIAYQLPRQERDKQGRFKSKKKMLRCPKF